jgi:hypothetical protein
MAEKIGENKMDIKIPVEIDYETLNQAWEFANGYQQHHFGICKDISKNMLSLMLHAKEHGEHWKEGNFGLRKMLWLSSIMNKSLASFKKTLHSDSR